MERTQTLAGDPTLISATTAGIAYAGLGLQPATIRIGEVDHWLACADVAIELERRHGSESVLTDRELRFQEQLTGRPIASAKLGETRNGYWRLHYPDLAVVDGDRATAYEVELTPKSQRRLETILRAWRRARYVERCIYLCPPGTLTQQAVESAIGRVRAEERVRRLRAATRKRSAVDGGDDVTSLHAGERSALGAGPMQSGLRSRAGNVPRVTLTKPEAAAALGISVDSFERHVQPELRIIRRGRMRLVPLEELERWAAENAAFTLDEGSAQRRNLAEQPARGPSEARKRDRDGGQAQAHPDGHSQTAHAGVPLTRGRRLQLLAVLRGMAQRPA